LAAALVIGVLALEKSGAVRLVRPVVYLGDSSYSIYLWHTMAISVVAKLASLLSIPSAVAMILAVVSGTAVGVVCYELLEKPLAAAFKSLRSRRNEKDAAKKLASA
jgi:exopolysaccharide production protein ExoZ